MLFSFDRNVFLSQIHAQFGNIPQSAADGLNFILGCIEQDITNWENLNQVAYGFATFKRETGDAFQPIHERGPVSYFGKYDPGTQLGAQLGNTAAGDGFLFRGRGYVQITGRKNYTYIGGQLKVDLVASPDHALQPDVAYKIASSGMKQGWFTAHRLSQYIPTGGAPDYFHARRIINGLDHADEIAANAQKFQSILEMALKPQPDATTASATSVPATTTPTP